MKEITGLDIGCGDYKRQRFIGIDLYRSKSVDVVADAQYLPFQDNLFSEINANQILEHLYTPFLSLKEWGRVLKKDGMIHVCIPNVTYYRRLIRYILNKPVSQNKDHIQCFTISELQNLMRNTGFEIIETQFLTEVWRKESISRFRGWLKHLTNRQLSVRIMKDEPKGG